MARYHHIFIDADSDEDSFVRTLEALLNIRFSRQQRNEDHWFESSFDDLPAKLVISTHGYEGELNGIWFNEYRYDMSVDHYAASRQYPNERFEAQRKLADQYFDTLKKTGRFRLLVTASLDEIINRFDP